MVGYEAFIFFWVGKLRRYSFTPEPHHRFFLFSTVLLFGRLLAGNLFDSGVLIRSAFSARSINLGYDSLPSRSCYVVHTRFDIHSGGPMRERLLIT